MNIRPACAAICAALLLVFPRALAADEEALRAYVREAVKNPKVFVFNPPAELRAYADLSPEELEKKMHAAFLDGSVLVLFPNGLPMKLESRRNHQADGECRTWYADGTLQSEEVFAHEQLRQGKYYDADGKLLSEVRDGSGRKIEFTVKEDGRTSARERETDYVDGLKDGRETFFAVWDGGRISSETHYRKGLKNGSSTSWRPGGQLSSLTNFSDDKEHGDSISWHENGNVRSLAEYDRGEQVGNSSRYAENGQKIEETIRSGKEPLLQMRWYPEGAMMVCKVYDSLTHRLIEASSFDRHGQVNGTVHDRRGALVVLDDERNSNGSAEQFLLERYSGKNTPDATALPGLRWRSAGRGKEAVNLKLSTQSGADFQEVSARVNPLAPNSEPIEIQSKIGDEKEYPATLALPSGPKEWTGAVYAQCTVKGGPGTFSFTQIIFSQEPERESESAPPPRETGPRPMHFSRHREPLEVKADGKSYPQLDDALSGWTSKSGQWLLYREPAALLYRKNVDAPWILQREISWRPEGLLMLGDDHLVVWGTKPTAAPEKGIPYAVEESRDGGKNWAPLTIPEMDFVVQMSAENGVWKVCGIRLPKDGVPKGKDWFEMKQTIFASNDGGRHFTELAGPSFFPTEGPALKSIAPNGRARIYTRDEGFQDSYVRFYFTEAPNKLPQPILGCGITPEIEWSPNSKVVALSEAGRLFAYYDTVTGKSETCGGEESREPLTEKQIAARRETDRRLRAILEAAR